ncbi:chemotaxis protein CheW [Haloferax namakaokahaiae]|uniref:Chemotaxis protein CheW n=1 Tax=Haloferax namakaokahaiae TaxID=1748331 RepID=A0ABD5ZHE1_9EURY
MSEGSIGMEDSEPIPPESVIEFLEFELDGHRYALEVGRVGQVVWRPPTTRVPNAPDGIYGSASIEGDVVVAVDTYAVVGSTRPFSDPKDAYLIVLDRGETPQPVGLLVEAVDGIDRHHVETVSPPSEDVAPLDDHWFRASIVSETGPDIPVFDSHQLLAALQSATTR